MFPPSFEPELAPTKQLKLAHKNLTDPKFKVYAEEAIGNVTTKIDIIGNHLTWLSVQYLMLAPCNNLIELSLNDNMICNKGCKKLSQGNWKQLQYLCLNGNLIQEYGLSHLAKAQWPSLKYLVLMKNKIRGNSIQVLNKANFPCLQSLSLTDRLKQNPLHFMLKGNRLEFFQVRKLAMNPWENLKLVWLNSVHFRKEECEYLKGIMKEKWVHGSIMLK